MSGTITMAGRSSGGASTRTQKYRSSTREIQEQHQRNIGVATEKYRSSSREIQEQHQRNTNYQRNTKFINARCKKILLKGRAPRTNFQLLRRYFVGLKKNLLCWFWLLGNILYLVVTLVTFSCSEQLQESSCLSVCRQRLWKGLCKK